MSWKDKLPILARTGAPAATAHGAGAPVVAGSGRGRLVFGLDATASRHATWETAQHIQSSMFDAAARLGGLDVKLVFYRGICTCKASAWTNDSRQLRKWMNAVACEGGNTQIERILAHAIMETRKRRVNALVFVGDAMEENPDRLCQLAAELGALGVPIFIFQEGTNDLVANIFKQMATVSKGAYFTFDLSSVDRLRELLAAVAVFASGGHAALVEHAKRRGNREVLRLTSQLSGR